MGAIMTIDENSVAKDDVLVDPHEPSSYKERSGVEPFKGRSMF